MRVPVRPRKEKTMKFNGCLIALLLCFCLLSCSDSKIAGTATDTENTIAGTVLLSDSSLASGVRVRQVAARTGISSAVLETLTDGSGCFAFDSVLADTVNIEFRYEENASLREVQLLRNVETRSAESLGVRLQKPAVLLGRLESAEDSAFWMGAHFFVSLDSTTFHADLFAPDSFEILAPEGAFLLSIVPADSGAVAKLRNAGYADSLIVRRLSISLAPGDTLNIGNLRWGLSEDEPTRTRRLKGVVANENGKPLKGVAVHVVTDLYGLGTSDADGFVTQAISDSNGIWNVAAPSLGLVADSFRVEFRGVDSLGRQIAGTSAYVARETLKSATGDISVDTVRLEPSADFLGKVFLVANGSENSRSDTLCWTYSIRVGFLGTSSFQTVNSCDAVRMLNLSPGAQDFIFYSGDELVVKNLKTGKSSPEDYVKVVHVNLPAGDTLKQQGFTYTPPMSTSGSF